MKMNKVTEEMRTTEKSYDKNDTGGNGTTIAVVSIEIITCKWKRLNRTIKHRKKSWMMFCNAIITKQYPTVIIEKQYKIKSERVKLHKLFHLYIIVSYIVPLLGR